MTDTLSIFRRMARLPAGKWLFSRMVVRKAPYFGTIRPYVRTLEPFHAEVVLPKRRAVENHIKTVHVIAAVNGLEAAMGLLAEASVPPTMRWIPKGMEVSYVAKATSDLLCVADSDPELWTSPGDVPVRVQAIRTDGTVTIEGTITVYLSEKQPAASRG